ncbi:MAG: AAA family ATPase [Candidatus Bathyarchaeota archaeon]|nr:AAA family ATPase [Candidatus Bathyarchaeota archaeon]
MTGSYGSGKDTVAEYFIQEGFVHFSLSDMIREEADARGLEKTRDNLIKLGKELRGTYGNGVLALRALEKFEVGKDYVVSSIRHTGEVEALKLRKDFSLVFVDAPPRVRFERMLVRGGRSDNILSFEEMLEKERVESQTSGPGQQLSLVKRMAPFVVINDAKLEKLFEKLARLHSDLLNRALR